MMLNNDVLALILDELDPTAGLGVRTLHSCLLVSRGSFRLAAGRLWPQHFWYLTGTGVAPKSELAKRGEDPVASNLINGVIERLFKPDDQPSVSAGDARRVWRCKVYLRSLTALCVGAAATRGPALVTPLMGKIRSVTIDTEATGPTALEELWLDWIKQQMSAGDGASEVVYAGEPVQRVLEFAAFQCVTTVAVTYWESDELEPLAAMVLNNSVVRNLRFVEGKYADRPVERLLENWREVPIKRPGALRQLRIDHHSRALLIMEAGFCAQFTSLTHLIVPSMMFGSNFKATELAGCTGTLKHLDVWLSLTADDVEPQLAVLGSCVNLKKLEVQLMRTTSDIRTRLCSAISRLVKLEKLAISGHIWRELPTVSLLHAMPRLRDLVLDFRIPILHARVVIPFRRLSTVAIFGIRQVVIEDIDAIIEAGWGRLEWMRDDGDVIGPGEVDGTATAGLALRDVMADAERTPMLDWAMWSASGLESKVAVRTGGVRELSWVK
ncbi:hypothetical protein HK101_007614 [Irineochytrium annulatum]|nr:hypothetical protein HK101_007614 [Irineochytrium annulatum]